MKSVDKYELKDKLVCFCADNAKANFGGDTRGGKNNVFYKLKQQIPHLIGVGCTAHNEHNALKFASDVLPFDLECVVVKIYSYFYRNTVRVTALKQFCDEADGIFMQLLGYAKTRFLALEPAVRRILKMFTPLQNYFVSLQKGEKMLKEFFSESSSKFWLHFICEQVNNELLHF